MTLAYYNMSLYSWIKSMGYSNDSFLSEILDSAKSQIVNDMLVYSISRAENITFSEAEYNEFLKDAALRYGYENVKDYEKSVEKADIERAVLTNKVVEYVGNNVVET